MATHPYRNMPPQAFWRRGVANGFDAVDLMPRAQLMYAGEKVSSAGSCFAANIVPYLESAGFAYVRTEVVPGIFGAIGDDNFSYGRFSASYGNIYTVRQAVQLIERAMGRFRPVESRWVVGEDLVLDPFRPGLRYPASSEAEFDVITARHLECVLEALRAADVFVFTLGLTEAWISRPDGAVFPACPGTVAGTYDPAMHAFHNFTVAEVSADLDRLIGLAREINPRLRFVLTVSPVPLVATATRDHVLMATTYSKSVLRVAAGEAAMRHREVSYFPAYEIVTGPQAPWEYYEADRRDPSRLAIDNVMRAFLSRCEAGGQVAPAPLPEPVAAKPAAAEAAQHAALETLSRAVAEALCEEAAAEL